MTPRDVSGLEQPLDVLVIGAGAYGASVGRILAHADLRVAIIDQGDFGAATSHNSLKIVHGGLRYLQDADVARVRESVRSQRTWLRCAPHLVRPLRFVMPTRGWGLRGSAAMRLGMMTYHSLAFDRNRGVLPARRLGRARVRRAGRAEPIHPAALAGESWRYASWYDAQIADANRLLWDCLLDAARAGAIVLNHVEARALRGTAASAVDGALVVDRLSGRELEVRARFTVLAAGPWGRRLLDGLPATREREGDDPAAWCRNVNLVVPRLWHNGDAIAVRAARGAGQALGRDERLLFVTPWQDCSIVGTRHEVFQGTPDAIELGDEELDAWVEEINAAMPDRTLGVDDIRYVHVGLTPADATGWLSRRSRLVDHAACGQVTGLLSIAGVKLTTAPEVARAAAETVLRRLGCAQRPMDFSRPLRAGVADCSAASENAGPLDWSETNWAAQIYADRHAEMRAAWRSAGPDALSPDDAVFRCRALFGMRCEMAVKLRDVLFRCTDRAERGALRREDLEWCADTMQRELGWTRQRRQQEVSECLEVLRRRARWAEAALHAGHASMAGAAAAGLGMNNGGEW